MTQPSGVTQIAPPPPSAAPTAPAAPGAVASEPSATALPAPAVLAPPPAVVAPPTAPPQANVAPLPAVAPPAAPSWSPVYTGSYFTRYELRKGYDDLGVSAGRARFVEGDAIFYRVRFGLSTGLFDLGQGIKVGLQFTPQTYGTFGNNGPNTIVDANLGLHEGYARVQGARTRFDSGRFELNYGDALVLGNLDWNEAGRTFDGIRTRFSSSPTSAWLDVFATVIDEGRPDYLGVADGDIYFLGAYAALGPMLSPGLELDGYAFLRAWGDANNVLATPGNTMSGYRRENAAEATLGARAKQKIGLFDYRGEVGLQAGSRPGLPVLNMGVPTQRTVDAIDVLAGQVDLELGVSFAEGRYRASLEGLYASGNDTGTPGKNEGWDELFPTAHKFLGLSDVFAQNGQKRTNVVSGVLHLTASPIKPLTVQIDGHVFARPEKQTPSGETGIAGGEVDVGAVYVIAKGLKVRALYGVFVPADDFYPVIANPMMAALGSADPAHYFEAELRYDLIP